MQTKTISYQYTWIWKSKSKQTKMTISLLVKMQSSWNAQTMLVGKQDYTATLENISRVCISEVSSEAKHTFTAQSSNSTICQSKVLTYV